MFSFFSTLLRWGVGLMAMVGLALSALAFQLRYEGDGRFQVRLKESLTFEQTLVWVDGAAPGAAASPAARPTPRRKPPAPPGALECASVRARLASSMQIWEARSGRRMDPLDIFALLEAEVLRDLPACPGGGAFRRVETRDRVGCTLHGH